MTPVDKLVTARRRSLFNSLLLLLPSLVTLSPDPQTTNEDSRAPSELHIHEWNTLLVSIWIRWGIWVGGQLGYEPAW